MHHILQLKKEDEMPTMDMAFLVCYYHKNVAFKVS